MSSILVDVLSHDKKSHSERRRLRRERRCAKHLPIDDCIDIKYVKKQANYDWQLSRRVDLTRSVEVRDLPIYDQGHLSTSEADAISYLYQFTALSQQYAFQNVNLSIVLDPSRLFIDYNGRQIGRGKVSLASCLQSINNYGVCSSVQWPYTHKNHKHHPDTCAYETARQSGSRKVLFERIPADDVDKVRQAQQSINNGQPLAATFTIFKSSKYDSGRMSVPSEDGFRHGPEFTHSLVLVGYDDSSSAFLARNNRGASWGVGGYCIIPYEVIADSRLCGDLWSLTSNNLDRVAQLNYTIEAAQPARIPRWFNSLESVEQLNNSDYVPIL
jgi:hypothetical protein